jgi:RNA polymerase sigma-70 factor, ECF subfamily
MKPRICLVAASWINRELESPVVVEIWAAGLFRADPKIVYGNIGSSSPLLTGNSDGTGQQATKISVLESRPMAAGPPDITGLLAAWGDGDEAALNDLMPVVYPELRRIARKHLARGFRPDTLESAVLVNEAYLKLIRAHDIRCENRYQFFALCARIIRRIVVDHARNRLYAKRGGGAVQIAIDDEVMGAPVKEVDVLALDGALAALAKIDPRKARVVELRYFGGLTVEEAAEALRISPETAKRDWKMAKAWLLRELTSG